MARGERILILLVLAIGILAAILFLLLPPKSAHGENPVARLLAGKTKPGEILSINLTITAEPTYEEGLARGVPVGSRGEVEIVLAGTVPTAQYATFVANTVHHFTAECLPPAEDGTPRIRPLSPKPLYGFGPEGPLFPNHPTRP